MWSLQDICVWAGDGWICMCASHACCLKPLLGKDGWEGLYGNEMPLSTCSVVSPIGMCSLILLISPDSSSISISILIWSHAQNLSSSSSSGHHCSTCFGGSAYEICVCDYTCVHMCQDLGSKLRKTTHGFWSLPPPSPPPPSGAQTGPSFTAETCMQNNHLHRWRIKETPPVQVAFLFFTSLTRRLWIWYMHC